MAKEENNTEEGVKSELSKILPDYHDENGNFILPGSEQPATAPQFTNNAQPTFQVPPPPQKKFEPTSTNIDLASGVAGGYLGSKAIPAVTTGLNTVGDKYDEISALKRGIPYDPSAPGQKWASKVTKYIRPTDYTVKEAAESYNMAKPQGKITSRVAQRTGINPPGVQQSSVDRLLAKSAPELSALDKSKALFGAVMSSPTIRGTLGGIGAGYSGADAVQRARQGDYLGAGIAGLGALGGLGTMTPLAVTGIPEAMSIGSPLALMALDKYREK